MRFVPAKTPKLFKLFFSKYIWDIPTSDKIIYLTFDDGPTPDITDWTLQLLKKYDAKATFFCIGANVEKHPEIFQHVLNEGHAIGNHTHNHVKGWKSSVSYYLENMTEAECVIEKESKILKIKTSKLFRPPYGQIKHKQARTLRNKGYNIIMWDVISFDWDNTIKKETCLKHVIQNTNRGSIVVFHDSVKASKNMQFTLPKVLEYFSKKGYKFEKLPF